MSQPPLHKLKECEPKTPNSKKCSNCERWFILSEGYLIVKRKYRMNYCRYCNRVKINKWLHKKLRNPKYAQGYKERQAQNKNRWNLRNKVNRFLEMQKAKNK